MANKIRAIDPGGLNKRSGSKFCIGSQVRQETPEVSRRTHRPKRCEYTNKNEDNSSKSLNDKLSSFVSKIQTTYTNYNILLVLELLTRRYVNFIAIFFVPFVKRIMKGKFFYKSYLRTELEILNLEKFFLYFKILLY